MSHRARYILLTVAVAAIVLVAYRARLRSGMADFDVYYRAGQRVWAGEPLYQAGDGHFVFKYLPASAIVFIPIGRLPLEAAKLTWLAISLAALACCFALVRRLVPVPHRRYLLLMTGLVLAKYLLHELRLGQINIVVMAVMLLATRFLTRGGARQDASAGVLAGVATLLKPYAAVFFPYFLLRRNWVAAAASAATILAALALPAIFYGVDGNLRQLHDWMATLTQSTPGLLTNADNVSVPAFFAKWLGNGTPALVASACVVAVLGAVMVAVAWGRTADGRRRVLECGMLLTLIPLVSPMGWDYTFLMSMLAVALIVNAFDTFPHGARLVLAVNFAIIALAVFDVLGRRAYATFMEWSITTVNFVLVVAALAYLRLRAEL